MDLLFKIYQDKPSRIGVNYKYEFQARKAYEELVRQHRGESFKLLMEPAMGKINLTLQGEQSGKKIVYKQLGFRPELLQKLEHFAKPDMELLFVHLYSEGNTLLVAKPFKKQEFFSITDCRIIGAGTFSS